MFLVTWQVGGGKPGASSVTLACTVDTVNRVINGTGSVFNDTPNGIRSHVRGSYRQLGLFGRRGHVVTIDGFQPIYYGDAARPNEMQNLHVKMALSEDWQTGQGSFSYFDHVNNKWEHVDDVTVQVIPNAGPGDAPAKAS